MIHTVIVEDRELKFSVDAPTGRVITVWPSDGVEPYPHLGDLERMGVLTSRFYGPSTYGHTSYFLVAARG